MTDLEVMEIAIQEAKTALSKSNFPVGAVLLINKEIIDKSQNQNRELGTLCFHAENSLLIKHSSLIKQAVQGKDFVEIYSTLEPCLYCFAGILQHNIHRLVFSVSDPNVGASSILPYLNDWYRKKNITIEKNILIDTYLPILYEDNKRYNRYDWDKLLALNNRK